MPVEEPEAAELAVAEEGLANGAGRFPHIARPRPSAGMLVRVYSYRAMAAMRSRLWWLRLGAWAIFIVALGWPLWEKHAFRGAIQLVIALLGVMAKSWRISSPQNIQWVRFQYLERKVGLYRVLKRLQQDSTLADATLTEMRTEILGLIASYVRGHRADHQGVEIFANLLVADGDDLRVIARDKDHRKPLASYPKAGMVATEALESGSPAVVSDLQKEYLWCADKPYRSVLALPVHVGSEIRAVLSIDSARPHHFDIEVDELTQALMPYVCLLGWTLDSPALILRNSQAKSLVQDESSP